MHLRGQRIRRASEVVDELRGEGDFPPTLVDHFRPSGACLCRRADCFYTFETGHPKPQARVERIQCGKSNSARGSNRRHRLSMEDDTGEEGRPGLRVGHECCHTCFSYRGPNIGDATTTSCAPSGKTSDAIVSELPARKTAATVRSKVKGAVGCHEVLVWEDQGGRLVQKHEKDVDHLVTHRHKRRLVKGTFDTVAVTPGRKNHE